MIEEVTDIVEILEGVVEDSPSRVRHEIELALKMLRSAKTEEDFVKVQEQLEEITNMSNVDVLISTEVYNAISIVENLIYS